MSRVLLVANPASQGGAAAALVPRILRALQALGHTTTLLETHPEHPTPQRVVASLAAQPSTELVVAVGGDGTFAEVARGILDSVPPRPPLALLPAGTANNHGKSLGVPSVYRDLDGALALLAQPHATFDMDVAVLIALSPNGLERQRWRFFDSVGWGLQSDVFWERRRLLETLPRTFTAGERGYILAALRVLFGALTTSPLFGAEITVDGVTSRHERLTDCVVSASTWYGGRWILDPRARPDDGLLEHVLFQGYRELVLKGLRDLVAAQPFLPQRLKSWPMSPASQGSLFELHFDRPVCSQIDGECGPRGAHFRVQLDSSKLKVLVGL